MASVIDVVMRMRDMVTGPLQHIRTQMEQTARANQRMGRDISSAGRSMRGISDAMMPMAAGIAMLGAAGGKAFIDFDYTITAAGAKAEATTEELQQMREVAKNLGRDFPISATQAAEGMDRLAAGGFNANQTMQAMPAIVTAAVASGEELATTSDVISSALAIWNMKEGDVAANAGRVADVVQMAANQSKLGMQDFGLAMQYAGAPAAALGVSIEELGTAMGIMSNNGIEASTIGTSLRSTFSRLAAPPKAAAAAIAQLGLQVKDSQGNFVGLDSIISQLRTSMAGYSNTEQVALMKALAGEEAYSGLLALVKTSPEAYQQMRDAIQNSSGSSQEAFEKMKKTMKGALEDMKGSIEALAISFGELLSPQVQAAANSIKGVADWMTNLSPSAKMMIAEIAAGVVAFTAFTFVASKVLGVGGSMITIYGQVGTVLAGGTIRNKLLQYSIQGTVGAFNHMRLAAAEAGMYLRTVFATLPSGGGTATFTQSVVAGFNRMRALTWAEIGASMKSGIMSGVNAIKEGITSIPGHISGMKQAAVSAFSSVRQSAVSAGKAVVNMVRGMSVSGAASAAAGAMKNLATAILSVGRASLAAMFSPMGIAIMAIAGAAYLLYQNWEKVGPFFVGLWQRITAAFQQAIQSMQPAINHLRGVFQILVDVVGARLMQAFNSIQGAIQRNSGAFRTLGSIMQVVGGILGGAVIGAFIVFANVAVSVVTTAIANVATIITMLINVLSGVITFVTGVFTGDWAMAWEGVKQIFSGVFDGILGICNNVLAGIKSAINGIISSINGISVSVPSWVPGIGGNTFGPLNIPMLYTGAENWPGGTAMIHDKGAEIVDLPKGTRVIPHDSSLQTAAAMGRRSAIREMQGSKRAGASIEINVNMGGVTIKDANADVDAFAHGIAQKILFEIQKRAINMNEGAV